MIKIGGEIGALNTIALVFLTAVIGIYYAKVQGKQTLKSGIINLYQNKVPIHDLMSGASIAFAALLLIIPGFITDFLGFLLLIPFTRKKIISLFMKRKRPVTDKKDYIEGEILDRDKKDDL